MRHDAFVSYASSDRVVAYRMVDYLESCGIRCWVAPRDVPGGRNYAEAILSALNEVDLFLLIFSEESNGSEHVQREVERALHLSKPIVPVRIVDVMPSGAMDYYLATLHWLDAFCTESGDSSDENAEGVELGCQDVTRAVGSLLGREDEVEKAIAAKIRAKQEAEERRKQEAEEREMRIRLEAEAHAQAELEAAAKAKAEIEAEDRRIREAEERQRKAEQEERERERERQREEREHEEEREQKKKEAREPGAAAGRTGTGSTAKLMIVSLFLLLLLVGGGWWAINYFDSGGRKGTQTAPLIHPPDPNPSIPGIPERIAKVRASFSWAEQQHFVGAVELLQLDSGSNERLRVGESQGDRLEIRILPGVDGKEGEALDEAVEANFELAIPGFSTISRRVVLEDGEQDIDFGPLARLQGEVKLISPYTDHPRAAEAHSEWLKNVQLVWQGIAESDLNGRKLSASAIQQVEELQRAGTATSGEMPALTEEEVSASLDSGVYAIYLETACQPPFDRVQIASAVLGEGVDAASVLVPIVPIGVFGGLTQWTSTSTDSAQDDDGTVTWNLYNLPEVLDLSSDGPRMVQSYVDIVDEGTRKKTIYLPAPITEVRFDAEKNAWTLRVDPREIVRTLVDDDLNDRYFEVIDFSISHHADKRTLLFDVEALDQPLNATEGTLRSFPLSNAYPVFANSVAALDAPQPGFGVVDVKAVYQHVEAISNKERAEDYRLTLTMPFSSSESLAVSLGLIPDREFSGSESMRIDAVQNGGPAAVAGVKAGDLVVGIGGLKIGGVGDFYRARFELPVGAPVEIKVQRDGREIALAVTPVAVAN